MKAPHERGELGAWLVEQRKRISEERGVKVTQQMVVDGLAEMGHPIDASYYRAIESGAKKTAGLELREALARYFGRTPPSPERGVAPAGDVGELVAAVREQTRAINELVEVLRDRPAMDPQSLAAVIGAAIASHLPQPPVVSATDPQSDTTR